MKRPRSGVFVSFALGVLLSILAVPRGNALTLLWTNPATNADGTVCTDLDVIMIEMVRESDGMTLMAIQQLCQLQDNGSTVCRSGPGLPDSTRVVLPVRHGVDWWHFTLFARDSTGNVSGPSNVVRVDLGDPGPITGIGDPPKQDADITAEDEWYDPQGRRINRPTASGIYFHRHGDVTEKVLIIK